MPAASRRPARRASAARLDITDLFRACLVALRVPELGEAYRPMPPKLWRIADAIGRMRRMLGDGVERRRSCGRSCRACRPGPEQELRCRAALASTLVAGLELAKEGALGLEQRRPWHSLRVSACGQAAETVREDAI